VRRKIEAGLEVEEPRYVPADKAREHLLHLKSCGIGATHVANVTGIDYRNIQKIRGGKKNFVTPRTETIILSVTDYDLGPKHFVDSTFSRHLVEEMMEAGYTLTDLNRMLGKKSQHQKLILGKHIRYENQKKLEELHFKLLRHMPKKLRPFPTRSGQMPK